MGNYSKYRRLPFDSRMAKEISSHRFMSANQGDNFLGEWGGPVQYQRVAKMSPNERVVFYAVEDGLNTPASISTATGLTISEVNKELAYLGQEGLIEKA